jgi:hypothetical protein
MLPEEEQEIVKMALEFWPKAQEYEVGLLRKQIKGADFDKIKEALEKTRLNSTYSTLPLKIINEKIKHIKSRGPASGSYITCYAVNTSTGKYLEVSVLAQSSDGARVEMAKYLEQWGMDIVDYEVFIGEENHQLYFDRRHAIACSLDPNIEENVKRIQSIVDRGGSVIDAVAGKM